MARTSIDGLKEKARLEERRFGVGKRRGWGGVVASADATETRCRANTAKKRVS